ncbi:hypothetical protein FGADI_4554 [Fusarium gaditjirri]|uniref:Uncharacterized protein n=1 Tax=Fusarium gaditjirri TaxID=282569 RepID=A0A8H4WZD7_9HYPO|nr:hypothetical protein FGADI_4554 [Fusarium gaditjirri]
MDFDSSCSGIAASTQIWDSDADSDSVFRDPTHRLRRYKSTVASSMFSLYRQGPEGIAILRQDELLFRGLEDPVMKDGTLTTDDIAFWKGKEQFFANEWRRIEAKKGNTKLPQSTMIGATAEKIHAWIPDPSLHDSITNERATTRVEQQTAEYTPSPSLDRRTRKHERKQAAATRRIRSEHAAIRKKKTRASNTSIRRSRTSAKAMGVSAYQVRRSRRLAQKPPEYPMLVC